MFHVKHFIKTVWNRKKCSDIAELLGNHQKNAKSSLKKFQKTFKQRKNRKNYCKTVLFKMFHVKHAKNLQFSYVSHRLIMQKCRKCFTWNISSSKIRRSMIKYLCPKLGQFWDRIWRIPQIDWHRKGDYSYIYAKTPAAWIIFLKEVPAGHFL